jgi:hypothetical protein
MAMASKRVGQYASRCRNSGEKGQEKRAGPKFAQKISRKFALPVGNLMSENEALPHVDVVDHFGIARRTDHRLERLRSLEGRAASSGSAVA